MDTVPSEYFRPLEPPALNEMAKASFTEDFSHLKLTEKLGKGAYKECFAIEGDPEHVLLVCISPHQYEANMLLEEQQILLKLSNLGIPCANYLKFGYYKSRGAVLMKRYAAGTRSSYRCTHDALLATCTEKTVESLRKLERVLEDTGLYISDLQFLIDHDGSWVVSDPLAVHMKLSSSNTLQLQTIRDFIITVREILHGYR